MLWRDKKFVIYNLKEKAFYSHEYYTVDTLFEADAFNYSDANDTISKMDEPENWETWGIERTYRTI